MTPSAIVSSPACASSLDAAASRMICTTSAAASRSAVPEFSIDCEPEVTPSFGVRPVSPGIMVTRASGRSSSSAGILASAGRMPCPSSTFPVNTVAVPSASMRIQASSIRLLERLPGSCFGCCASAGSSEKASTMPPMPFAKSRRERDTFMSRPPHLVGGAQDRPHDPVVRPAAAEVGGERLPDIGLIRFRIAIEQRLGAHDHAVDAVAALSGLLGDEGTLQRMRLLERAEALERDDLGALQRVDRRHAGAHRLPVHQHGAGAAL